MKLWQYPEPLDLFTAIQEELSKSENEALKLAVESGHIAYTDVPTILLHQLAEHTNEAKARGF